MSDTEKIVGEAYRYMMVEDLTAAQRREWNDYDRELRIANNAIYRWRFVAPLECEVEVK
jgi:hypothetical protein